MQATVIILGPVSFNSVYVGTYSLDDICMAHVLHLDHTSGTNYRVRILWVEHVFEAPDAIIL